MELEPGPRKHTPPISEFLSRMIILRAARPEPTRITMPRETPERTVRLIYSWLHTSHIITDLMQVRRGKAAKLCHSSCQLTCISLQVPRLLEMQQRPQKQQKSRQTRKG